MKTIISLIELLKNNPETNKNCCFNVLSCKFNLLYDTDGIDISYELNFQNKMKKTVNNTNCPYMNFIRNYDEPIDTKKYLLFQTKFTKIR